MHCDIAYIMLERFKAAYDQQGLSLLGTKTARYNQLLLKIYPEGSPSKD